jgi:hypothetical protein
MESSIPAAEPPCDNALNRLHIIALSKRAVSGDRYGLLLSTSALYFLSGHEDFFGAGSTFHPIHRISASHRTDANNSARVNHWVMSIRLVLW